MAQTVTIPNIAGAETITGPWTFSGNFVVPTRTRKLFLPSNILVQSNGTAMTLTTQGTYPDSWSQWPMVTGPAAAPQALYGGFMVPVDYDSGGEFFVWYSQSSTSVALWRAEVNYIERANTNDPTAAASVVAASITPDGVVNQTQRDSVGTVLATLTSGNWVRFNFERDSAHADDTNADTIRIIGIEFSYTARQSNT